MVYDVPHRITSLLRDREVPIVHQEFKKLVPGWCLESGVRHFMTSFGIKNEGGRLLFPRLERARASEEVGRLISSKEAPTTRLGELRVGGDFGLASAGVEAFHANSKPNSELNIRSRAKSSVLSPPISDGVGEQDYTQFSPPAPDFKRQQREPGLEATVSRIGTMPAIHEELPGSAYLLEPTQEPSTGCAVNPMDDCELDRLELEGQEEVTEVRATTKATMADDAAVAVEEWDERLVQGLGLELNEKRAIAAGVLRDWRLRCWKRRQTRGFFSWLHQRPEYQAVGLDSMDYVVGLAQLYNPQSGDQEEDPSPQYRWAIQGQAVYCAWWEDRDARHYKDFERARDAIGRFSNNDWWEWTDGSAPAHWKWPEWYRETIRDGLPV
jgi:hypothetical protein